MTKQFKFQDPSGKVHVLEGPDDATDEQAFAILQQQESGNSPQPAAVQGGAPPAQSVAGDRATVAQAAAQPVAPRKAARPTSGVTEQLLRSLGLSVRPAAEAAGSTVGMVGDALNTGINMAGDAIGHNPQLGMPSQAIERGIDSVLPKPETDQEKLVNAVSSMGYGAMGADPLANAIAKRLPKATPRPATPREQTLLDAQAAGYKLTPDQVPGTGFKGKVAELFAGKRPLIQAAQSHNQGISNQIATREAGLPAGMPLTPDTLRNAMSDTYQQGYKPIEDVGQMTNGGVYRKALDKVLTDFQGASASFPGAARDNVSDLVRNYRVPTYDSKDALNAIRTLRQDATTAFPKDTAFAHANNGIANALEGSIDLNLQARGQPGDAWMLDAYRAARTQLAKQNEVSKAVQVGSGDVNATRFGASVQKGKGLTDGLRTMGQFANISPELTKMPSAQAPVSTLSHILGAGIPPILAAALFGPHAAVAAAGLPLARGALRSGMLSKFGQSMIAPNGMNPGTLEKAIGNTHLQQALPSYLNQFGLYGEDDQ